MNFRKLTPVQKKWALTTGLLMVLGFNLSAPIKRSATSGSIELAATALPKDQQAIEELEEKLALMKEAAAKKAAAPKNSATTKTVKIRLGTGEKVDVTLTKTGTNKTTASLPEGTIQECEKETGCDKLTVPHSIESMSEIADFIYEKTGKPIDKEEDENEDKKPAKRGGVAKSDKEDDDMALLKEKVLDRCKRYEKAAAKSKCLTESFARTLKDKTISAEIALEFFNNEMRGVLKAALKNQSLAEIKAQASALGSTGVFGASDAFKNTEFINTLLSSGGLAGKYNAIRDSIVKMNKEVLAEFAGQALAKQTEAKNVEDRIRDLESKARQAEFRGNRRDAEISREEARAINQKFGSLAGEAKDELTTLMQIINPTLYNQTNSALQSALSGSLLQKSAVDVMLESLRKESDDLRLKLADLERRGSNQTESPVGKYNEKGMIYVGGSGSEWDRKDPQTGGSIIGSGGVTRQGMPGQQPITNFRGSQGGSIRGN